MNASTTPQPIPNPQPTPAPVSPLAAKLAVSKHYYWFLVTYLVLLSALGSFVNDMYTPALPSMCRFFGCSIPLGQMGLTMGMIGLAIGQFVLGPVSDKYGRKPVMIFATALFVVAAVVSIFSPSIHFFNICRLFQGMGASAGYFLARTIPTDVFRGRELAKLMALIGAINGIAPASSPVVGGIASDVWGWKSVFIILAIFAAVIILLSGKMQESLPVASRYKGSFFSSFKGYRTLFANHPFMIHTWLKGTSLGLLFAYISSSPFILQNHYGMSQTGYGLLIGFNALFMMAGSMISLKFKPYKKAAFIGSLIMAAGVAGEAVVLFCVHSIWLYDAFTVVILFALGMIFSTSNTLAMNEGRDRSGEAAAVLGISGYIVGSIVSPLVGIGNILHSTAYVYVGLTVVILFFAFATRRLPADLDA